MDTFDYRVLMIPPEVRNDHKELEKWLCGWGDAGYELCGWTDMHDRSQFGPEKMFVFKRRVVDVED